jgi:uncharacterized membrane protein
MGSGAYAVGARTGNAAIDTAILAGTAAAGLSARYLIPWSEQEPRWRAPVRSAAQVVGAGAASAAIVSAVRNSASGTALSLTAGAVAATVAALQVKKQIKRQDSERDEFDFETPNPLRSLVQGAGILGVLGALIGGYRNSGGALARTMERRLGLSPTVARYSGDAIATTVWVLGVRAAYQSVTAGLARYDRVVDPGYDQPPQTSERSGGPDSEVPWSRLGRQGRRFITDAPSMETIEQVMGQPAVAEPVRIFVGYDAARSAEARVALAIAELRRTSAFDRSILIVSAPAGTGYVNTLPMEVADYATLGDSAAVAVQYARLPSLLALQQTPSGANHHRLLLSAIRDELHTRPPEDRPRVVVYGESLGSWAGQDAFIDGGPIAFKDMGVSEALWVGTPYYSKWRRQALEHGAPGGTVVEINSLDELARNASSRCSRITTTRWTASTCRCSIGRRRGSWSHR